MSGRRVISAWLPDLAVDRLRRAGDDALSANTPLAVTTALRGAQRLAAVCPRARAAGLAIGQALADARALCPALAARPADPAADGRLLAGLADWAQRYTPWTAVDDMGGGPDPLLPVGGGLWLEVGGSARLFGGEAALLDDLAARLAGLGLSVRLGLADSPGAAWALARFGGGPVARVAGPDETEAALFPLPLAALRLDAATVAGLSRMGLRRIGDLADLPRAPLTARFGAAPAQRLDQARGRIDEAIAPRRPPPALRARLAFAEPIGRAEDLALAAEHLTADLCADLAAQHLGARRLELAFFRVDGTVAGARLATSRPSRDARHLARLLVGKLDGLDPGFGIETAILSAARVEPLSPAQAGLTRDDETGRDTTLAHLIDRLGARLGPDRVLRLEPRGSHLPERACRPVPAFGDERPEKPDDPPPDDVEAPPTPPRPLHLLPWPEPIEVVAPLPDHPPVMLRWRRRQIRVARAEGPERIGPEWWRVEPPAALDAPDPAESIQAPIRDYYRIEDPDGLRLWVFREGVYRPGPPPRWFVHGVFP